MGLSDYKINSFSKPVSALDDTPQMSASELKEWFDSNSANELKNSVNGIIEELKDVDVSKQHTHKNKEILDNIENTPIYDAPSDGKMYARKDGTWSAFDDNIITDTYVTKAEAVGQKTNGGEIFNDYENNKAFSPFSSAAGYNTKAGMRGFFYSNIEFGDTYDIITLSDMQNYGTDTDTDLSQIIAQYPVDSYISMVNGNKFYKCAKILSVNANTIKVEKLPFDSIIETSSPDIDDWSLWVESSPEIGVVALGYYAHSNGENSIALERASYAGGRDNVAYGQYSFVVGRNNRAAYTGFTAGRDNIASGETACALGRKTVASGRFAQSQGYGTIACGESQNAQGKYNIEDKNNEFACIVGNGTGESESERSNAYTLDWEGKAWFAKDVVAGDVSLKELNDTVGNIGLALDSIVDMQHELMGVVRFNIEDNEYIAPKGTWSNFINSSYNDGTFTALREDGRTYVVVDDLKVCIGLEPVYLTDEIISGTTYSLYIVDEI